MNGQQQITELNLKLLNLIPYLEGQVLDLISTEEITDTVKGQLWDGQTSEEQPIKPSHSQSSFFKSAEKKDKYIQWKESFTANPKRDPDTPNLFINGKFYSEIKTFKEAKQFRVDAQGKMSGKILPVFKNILGLTQTNADKKTDEILPEIISNLNNYLNV